MLLPERGEFPCDWLRIPGLPLLGSGKRSANLLYRPGENKRRNRQRISCDQADQPPIAAGPQAVAVLSLQARPKGLHNIRIVRSTSFLHSTKKMALRKIITYPNPILRQQARPVTVFDEELKKLVADMGETMFAAPGVGLAANQIGLPVQIVVVDQSTKGKKD